jgi:hypothetical protein
MFTLAPETTYTFVFVWAHIESVWKNGVVANGKVRDSW